MRLVNFLLSMIGFLMFSILLILFIGYVKLKRIETVSKFVIVFLMISNLLGLTTYAYYYYNEVD